MKDHYFLTGTDTDVGKTFIACAMLKAAAQRGYSTLGLKPIAAGCEWEGDRLVNRDAKALIEASAIKLKYSAVNPVALLEPIAPHIAAAKTEVLLSVDILANHSRQCLTNANWILIEGAGGWRVPLNAHETLAGLPKALELSVILVVGLKLGCLNHALLTVEAIERDGLSLAGWVANQIDPEMLVVEENFDTLKKSIHAPCLGFIPYQHQPCVNHAATLLDIGKITQK